MISIAMATYNGDKYLHEQIDSILAQTEQDFELVVSDDHSMDKTWEILQEYASKYSRIHIYQNEQNLGFVKNFERAMTLCKGEYIALCDQDDIWTFDHLSVLLENIGENSCCCGDAILLENGELTDRLSKRDGVVVTYLDTPDKKLKRILYSGSPFQGASMMVKQSHLKYIFPFPSINMHDVWIALYACINNSMEYTVDKTITYYRQHAAQITRHEKRSQWYYVRNLNRNKYKQSDRLLYINALLQRFPEMDENHKNELLMAKRWFEKQHSRWFRFKNIPFWIKTYPYRFPNQSRKLLLLKLARFLFL
ncbi:MAG: glycosyltransferase [Bacteroidales bacterium]|jgi:glycosyltransferase involved in cell wall biosynthesis|nr:glycosyltransferase [Bacteroidales bacterium]